MSSRLSRLALAVVTFSGNLLSAECNTSILFEKVNSELASRQYEPAAHALNELEKCKGLSDSQLFQVGWFYGRARHFDDALKLFNRVPDTIPDRPTHAFAIALSRFELGDYHGVTIELAALKSAGLADSKSINLLAVSYSKLGLYKEAYSLLSEEVRKNPSDLNSHLNLITACAEGGDFKNAAAAASEAIKLFPESADAFVAHGAAEALLGQFDAALKDFSRGAEIDSRRSDIRFFLALMDYKIDKYQDAAQVLQTAIKGGMQDSDLNYLLAECLLKTGDGNQAGALDQLNQAIASNAESVSARTLRGKLLLESGHAQNAISDLEVANKLDPEYRGAIYNLARAYHLVGRNAESQALFQKLHDQSTSLVLETGDRRLNEALSPKDTGQK